MATEETKQPNSAGKITLYICDICGAERNGHAKRCYVDAPYLPHIKNQLVNVCLECRKQVITINPEDLKKKGEWDW